MASLCRLAARGAGLPWAMAEEAKFSAKILSQADIDFAALLIEMLTCPVPKLQFQDGVFSNDRKDIQSIYLGAALPDFLSVQTSAIRADAVIAPVFLLPFLQVAAKKSDGAFQLSVGDATVICGPTAIAGDPTALLVKKSDIRVTPATDTTEQQPKASRVVLSAFDYEALQSLAAKTYAPATEESRRLGAG